MTGEKITERLVDARVPAEVIPQKVADTRIGWLLVLFGLLICVGAVAALLLFAWTKTEVGAAITTILLAFVFVCLALVSVGSNLVARDAAPPAYKSFVDGVVRVLGSWRGNGGAA